MGRRPDKDDQEQVDQGEAHVPGHRGPAGDRRKSAGRAADHDVLRRTPLQPDRIHEYVERDGQREHRGRHPVQREAHHHH